VASRTNSQRRYERYQRVVTAALANDEFAIVDLRTACHEETAAFVNGVVRQLAADRVIEVTGPKARPVGRWLQDRERFVSSRWIESRIFRGQITHSPESERPRERLLSQGAAGLRTADLLAILVRSGRTGESALQAGEKVAARFAGRMGELPGAGRGELRQISACVGETAYCQIMAGIELGRRVAAALDATQEPTPVRSTFDAIRYCRTHFARLVQDGAQEEFYVITLDTKNQVLGTHQVSVGLLDQTVVHPREVFRPAIRDAAKSVILVHNHPSGDATPSDKDRTLTQRMKDAGQTIGIEVLDHVIVARRGAVSLSELDASTSG
jgi:DNA repair protein RadC